MAHVHGQNMHHKNNKKFVNKNKSVRIFREKKKKTDLYQQQVKELIKKYEEIDASKVQKFEDFPLTDRTQKALKRWKYVTPTDIQKDSIGLALKGHDILGAAKTGSGKTLAFVIPVLECLFREGWSILDGLGAMIITPTRELAYQIFEVFNKVGENHQFSVALVIGGKDLAKERKLINKCNVVICTPGRVLQHMDENPLFDAMNLKVLVLDEADRILDLGFERTMNAILENLPQDRQTILFSATQTKSVKDLARLSLKDPMYVSVHEHAEHSTPESLEQSYLVCEAQTKMSLLWSFLKSHRKQKILVFLASCKQVKYTFEIFCRMKPGLSVVALYGSLHQLRRMQIYDDFCRKNHVVMFATDIAARGLDFPNVNWVIQLDCPEDVNTYIHRAGRTARYKNGGESLLILLPSEQESMVKQLQDRKIPISEIKVNPSKLFSIQKKMEALCAYDVNLKDSSQRAFKAYLKSIFLMKDKAIFDVTKLDTEAYAKSLGMAFAPRIRFVEKRLKNMTKAVQSFDTRVSSKEEPSLLSREKGVALSALRDSDDDSDDDFLKPKGNVELHSDENSDEETVKHDVEAAKPKKPVTKAALAKKILKKKIKTNTIIKYDDAGKPIQDIPSKQLATVANELGKEMLEEGYCIEKAKLIMDKEDEIDKELYKNKIKARHKMERLKQKELRRPQNPSTAPQLKDSEGEEDEDNSDIDPNNMSGSDIDPNTMSNSDVDPNNISSSENEEENKIISVSPSHDFEKQESTTLSDEEESLNRNKRKKKTKDRKNKVRKISNDNLNDIRREFSVEDDESLALHFLMNT